MDIISDGQLDSLIQGGAIGISILLIGLVAFLVHNIIKINRENNQLQREIVEKHSKVMKDFDNTLNNHYNDMGGHMGEMRMMIKNDQMDRKNMVGVLHTATQQNSQNMKFVERMKGILEKYDK